MFVPINNAFAGKMYTSKTTIHCLTRQKIDGIEWKVATYTEKHHSIRANVIHLCKCIKQLPAQ